MSKISTTLKRLILWMLGSGQIEFLLEISRRVVSRLDHRDDMKADEKREAAKVEIRQKLKDLGRNFSSHMINLAIELVLVEFREEIE